MEPARTSRQAQRTRIAAGSAVITTSGSGAWTELRFIAGVFRTLASNVNLALAVDDRPYLAWIGAHPEYS